MSRTPAVMVDLDGTVCLTCDRNVYDMTRVGEDLPNEPVIAVVRAVRAAGYALVMCSGRNERARRQTESWLAHHVGEFDALFLRADHDRRPDHVMKVELYRRRIEPRYDVLAVFDDRQAVVDAWRAIGLTVLQVAPGRF